MPRFRVLHASDLHFSTVPYQVGLPDWLFRPSLARFLRQGHSASVSSQDSDVVDALASFAYHNRQGYDVILLSGDLAATGGPGDLDQARRFIEAPPVQGYLGQDQQPTLQATVKEIALLPGSHDRFGRPSSVYPPGDTRFDAAFGRYWSVGQSAQTLWTGYRGGAYLILVGVDLTLRTGDWRNLPPLGHFGQGRAYHDRIATLERVTLEVRARYPGACTILWILHFDPDTKQGLLKVLDEGNLAQALRRQKISAILCGHTHQSQVKRFTNVPVFVCGTTAQYVAPTGNLLHVLEIDATLDPAVPPAITLKRFRFDAAQKVFVPVP